MNKFRVFRPHRSVLTSAVIVPVLMLLMAACGGSDEEGFPIEESNTPTRSVVTPLATATPLGHSDADCGYTLGHGNAPGYRDAGFGYAFSHRNALGYGNAVGYCYAHIHPGCPGRTEGDWGV